jgi:hypothetical protein
MVLLGTQDQYTSQNNTNDKSISFFEVLYCSSNLTIVILIITGDNKYNESKMSYMFFYKHSSKTLIVKS